MGGEFYGFSFYLMYAIFGAKEASNPETPIKENFKKSHKKMKGKTNKTEIFWTMTTWP